MYMTLLYGICLKCDENIGLNFKYVLKFVYITNKKSYCLD